MTHSAFVKGSPTQPCTTIDPNGYPGEAILSCIGYLDMCGTKGVFGLFWSEMTWRF